MKSLKKIFSILPFAAISVIVLINWYTLITEQYLLSNKHIAALILIGINSIVYFFKHRLALLLTGIILVLSTFNLISLTVTVTTTSYFVTVGSLKISSPAIHWLSLLILAIFAIGNFELLKSYYKKIIDFINA